MASGLRIAFFGSSLVSAYWNGAATYYRGILKALHARGHQITFFEPDAYDRQQHRDIEDPPYARSVVYAGDSDDAALEALEQAFDSDVVVKASGVGVYDRLLERAVVDLAWPGQICIFWDVDAPATLERLERDDRDPFHDLAYRYDAIFTYGGGDPVVRAYQRFGARECRPIYNALDPETHFPVEPESRFAADLAFLGNRMPDREARVAEFFFEAARRAPDRRFLLGGSGWWDISDRYSNVGYCGHVFTHDHNAFNCSPRAVLNISRESMARFGFSPATRVFEAAGAGACLITDDWEGLELFLEPGRECLAARSGEEVAEHLGSLSAAKARALGSAARRRVLAEHTYDKRAEQVEEALGVRLSHAGSIR